jgi:hypothetical protein
MATTRKTLRESVTVTLESWDVDLDDGSESREFVTTVIQGDDEDSVRTVTVRCPPEKVHERWRDRVRAVMDFFSGFQSL